jgi:predicted nuclease of restriction endonuclease-like (RecB) superfamily
LSKLSTFDQLLTALSTAHDTLQAQAMRAVNTGLTLRNWLFGFYIETYERGGVDRQKYGDKLLDKLAEHLSAQGLPRCDKRELYRYRQFYLTYPSIVESLSPQLQKAALLLAPGSVDKIVESLSPQSEKSLVDAPLPDLIARWSFSHISELLNLNDAVQRRFYELECMRGNWSVRELRRQIASLYYERSGLSTDKAALSANAQADAEQGNAAQTIRDPYVFEFLGLQPQEVMSESHLEAQLLDKLQYFLLEMGHGFCFEARQKRILIGEGHYFVDMVFYHRILKCHVLVELKVGAFTHENIGQLNTYVSWYRKHMMTAGDNPPVGILLCTQKDHALVEYATAAMDNEIFVSRYQLELPKKEDMQRFIESQLV